MKARRLDVPELVRKKALLQGESGLQWLQGLDDLVDQVSREWRLSVGDALRGGTEAYVAAAETEGGDRPCRAAGRRRLRPRT